MKYTRATSNMMSIVKRIVSVHHRRLDGAKIAVVCREKAAKTHGRTIMATASKPPPGLKPLLDDDYSFVITIAADTWNTLTPAQRKALIDHELCHCVFKEDKPAMRGHDLEEFGEIVERHGFWRKDEGEEVIQQGLLAIGVKVGTMK